MNNEEWPEQNKFMEVSTVDKIVSQEIDKRKKNMILCAIGALAWSVIVFWWWGFAVLNSQFGILVIVLPWILIVAWIANVQASARKEFWVQVSKKYGWKYDISKDFLKEDALLFGLGHSQGIINGISGIYHDHPVHLFEYHYSVGSGKHEQTFLLTVFEVTFTGTFPHLYLNYKRDAQSNPPNMDVVAKISLPQEFNNKFDFYSPKEYEIETLEIFTPDVFAHLLDAGWKHDMEFVSGELVIYSSIQINSLAELEAELNRIKGFLDILAPRLNRLKLAQIGDRPSMLE